MARKSWSYNQITANAEDKIKTLMERALLEPNDFAKWQFRHSAWGVFWGWYTLTQGWQNEGDRERLENLTKF